MFKAVVLLGLFVVAASAQFEAELQDDPDTDLTAKDLQDYIFRRLKREANITEAGTPEASPGGTADGGKGKEDEGEEGEEEEQTEDALPVAEKFIGTRRKHPRDELREKMIGMIFTGEPQPLGPPQRYSPPTRRRFRPQPHFSQDFQQTELRSQESPPEILKPMPFVPRPSNVEFPVPRPSNVEFPVPRLQHSASRHPHEFARLPPPKSHMEFRPPISQTSRHDHRSISRIHKPFRPGQEEKFPRSKDIFSNTVGPDFGPVTFEEFGANFENEFDTFDSSIPSKKPLKPSRFPPRKPIFKPSEEERGPPFGFSNTKFGGFDESPKFNRFPAPQSHDGCHRYTEDICLDTDTYPHEEILSSLASDPARARTLMAEVKEQSADELVDGVSADQESKYDFGHYFGNRRQDNVNRIHRDFAEDGGYLCPSEVKYARPKRARNSKGEWKFIVNMDKYSQTIRMEKCMKPGGSCSYVSHHYRATCNQIHNYQRLLSWEKKRGLHMDIFKVPSCCSCHIQGYAYVFPPLGKRDREFSAASERKFRYLSPDSTSVVQDVNREAPPYSPVNFPNIPLQPEEDLTARSSGVIPRNNQGKTPRRRVPLNAGASIKRSNHPDHRVNYDYHPIIDFFQRSRS